MAAISSTGNGTWPANLSATPTGADDVTITHQIAIPSGVAAVARTVTVSGAGGAAQLTIDPGGSLTSGVSGTLVDCLTLAPSAATTMPLFVNNGSFYIKGSVKQGNCPVSLGGGSLTEWDRTVTHAGLLLWQQGLDYFQANSYVQTAGTSAGSRAVIRSSAAGAGARGNFANGYGGNGHLRLQYADLTRVGKAGSTYADILCNPDYYNGYGSQAWFWDCTFDDCGEIQVGGGSGVTDAVFQIKRCKFTNSPGSNNLYFATVNGFGGASDITVEDTRFDKVATIWVNGIKVRRTLFRSPFNLSGGVSSLGAWEYNVCEKTSQPTWSATLASGATLAFGPTYIAINGTIGNPHFFQVTAASAAVTGTLSFDGWIFDSRTETTDGDGLTGFVCSGTCTVRNSLVLPTDSGKSTCTLLTTVVDTKDLDLYFYHNTCAGKWLGADGGVQLCEGAGAGKYHQVKAVQSNIAWSGTADTAALVYYYNGGSAVDGQLDPAGATYNAIYNGKTSAVGAASGNPAGYLITTTHVERPSGATDVTSDPAFVDPTRNIATWDASLGGAGTVTAAMDRIAADTSSTIITDLFAWVRAGWAPTAAAYNPAGAGAGHDGLTRGAVAWAGAGGGTTSARRHRAAIAAARGHRMR